MQIAAIVKIAVIWKLDRLGRRLHRLVKTVADLCKELKIKPVTLYQYVDPDGNMREHGKRLRGA